MNSPNKTMVSVYLIVLEMHLTERLVKKKKLRDLVEQDGLEYTKE